MRAVRVRDGRPRVLEVERPRGDGVRVRVGAAGICGSDLHLLALGAAPAVTLGHEVAGWAPDGRPVAVEPLEPCGRCAECAVGAYHLCDRIMAAMPGISVDGGMADEMVVPERCLVPLPRGLEVDDAALVEPLAVAIHGIELAGDLVGRRVAVIGAGSIGLLAAVAALDAGATVAVAARHDHQAEAALRLGAAVGVDGDHDVVFETAGTAGAMVDAVGAVRPGGTVVMLSIHWAPQPGPGLALWTKEVHLLHSMTYCGRNGRRDVEVAASLLARRPEVAEALITHRFPLDAATEAFSVAAERGAGAIKVLLRP